MITVSVVPSDRRCEWTSRARVASRRVSSWRTNTRLSCLTMTRLSGSSMTVRLPPSSVCCVRLFCRSCSRSAPCPAGAKPGVNFKLKFGCAPCGAGALGRAARSGGAPGARAPGPVVDLRLKPVSGTCALLGAGAGVALFFGAGAIGAPCGCSDLPGAIPGTGTNGVAPGGGCVLPGDGGVAPCGATEFGGGKIFSAGGVMTLGCTLGTTGGVTTGGAIISSRGRRFLSRSCNCCCSWGSTGCCGTTCGVVGGMIFGTTGSFSIGCFFWYAGGPPGPGPGGCP